MQFFTLSFLTLTAGLTIKSTNNPAKRAAVITSQVNNKYKKVQGGKRARHRARSYNDHLRAIEVEEEMQQKKRVKHERKHIEELQKNWRAKPIPDAATQWANIEEYEQKHINICLDKMNQPKDADKPTKEQMVRILAEDDWARTRKVLCDIRVFDIGDYLPHERPRTLDHLISGQVVSGDVVKNVRMEHGYVVIPRHEGIVELKRRAEAGEFVLIGELDDYGLEKDCEDAEIYGKQLVPSLEISYMPDGTTLILTVNHDIPMAFFPVSANIETPMMVNKLAEMSEEEFPGVHEYNNLLQNQQLIGTAGHIAWALSSSFKTDDKVYNFVKKNAKNSWGELQRQQLNELTAEHVRNIAEGYLLAHGENDFKGEWGPLAYDRLVVKRAGYDVN